jgi:hypothetical protein
MSKRNTSRIKPQHRRKPDQAVTTEPVTSNNTEAEFLPWKAPFAADGVSVRDVTGRAVCLCATASSPVKVRKAAATRIAAALNAQE